MGDRPAATISREAIYPTADIFKDTCPNVQGLLRLATYVDKIVDSFPSQQQALNVASDTEEVLGRPDLFESSAGF